MKKSAPHLITEVPRRRTKVETTIGIDLGDVWSHYCTLNQDERGGQPRPLQELRPKAIEKWFTDVPSARVAMEAGTHSIWISQQLEELGHEVIVANVRELRAISHSDRKSDKVDAEKLARYARLDPEILRPRTHRTVEQQQALTLIRARNVLVRLRHRGSERRARSHQGMWAPYAGDNDTLFCEAQPGSDAARARAGAEPGTRPDRRDDSQDQAV